MTETEPRPRRHVRRWVFLAGLLAAGSCAYYVRNHTGQNALAFDRERWLAFERDEHEYSTRYNMVGDLIRRHQLVGMTRREVEELLGPPERESQNSLYPYPGWDLGLHPGHGSTNSTALCIEFGPDGRVVKVWNPGK